MTLVHLDSINELGKEAKFGMGVKLNMGIYDLDVYKRTLYRTLAHRGHSD